MQPGFETFDHTADMGIRVFAPTVEGLIEPATQALYSLIGELVTVMESEAWRFDLTYDDNGDTVLLLRHYLNNLLYEFECRHRQVLQPVVLEYSRQRLVVEGQAQLVDHERSTYCREVKAITYHGLAIREIPGGYEATVIVDI